MQLLLLRHLQSLLCTIIKKTHVIAHRHLTERTGSLRGRTYSSEVYGVKHPQASGSAIRRLH